jgi:hypothetical protein
LISSLPDSILSFATLAIMRLIAAWLMVVLMTLTGCTGPNAAGSLRVQSLGRDPVSLATRFRSAFYSYDVVAGTSFMLSDVSVDKLLDGSAASGLIMHIELLWLPKPGRTPLDPTATNASIRLIVIADGEVGVYGGAGFAMPNGTPAEERSVSLALRDASLQLLESTPGFNDLLSPAQLTGSVTSRRNEAETLKLNLAASQLVTNALKQTRFVKIRTREDASG